MVRVVTDSRSLHTTYRGEIYTPLSSGSWRHLAQGALVVDGVGKIVAVGAQPDVVSFGDGHDKSRVGSSLILPGLIDCHQHLSHYEWVPLVPDLFEWLRRIYAVETRFADTLHARAIAKAFFLELARNGTTTCCVHGPYFRDATVVAFEEAEASGLRVLMGMNMGDSDLPADLTVESTESLLDADRLHATWSGRAEGLIDYVYTIRPAYCASERLLRGVGDRAQAANGWVQSHLGESANGRARIASRFPQMKNETDVYEACGLLTSRTVMAHGVYTDDEELQVLAERRVGVAHCPRANLLSGGQQMRLRKYEAAGVRVGLGSDLGAGKGLSLFRTMEDALKVTPDLSIHDLFRLATLEGARALSLEQVTGSLEVGKDADFLVVSPKSEGRERELDLEDTLSSLVFRGDDRDIRQVFVKGKLLAIG